jgi:hypothetical protein
MAFMPGVIMSGVLMPAILMGDDTVRSPLVDRSRVVVVTVLNFVG